MYLFSGAEATTTASSGWPAVGTSPCFACKPLRLTHCVQLSAFRSRATLQRDVFGTRAISSRRILYHQPFSHSVAQPLIHTAPHWHGAHAAYLPRPVHCGFTA
jgi:hypothetical protein